MVEGVWVGVQREVASMKVPPKRKGNGPATSALTTPPTGLNESPSEKEGKWVSR